MEQNPSVATLRDVYSEYMKVACSETEIAQSNHPVYLHWRNRVTETVTAVYGEVLAEFVLDWMDDCNEVPSIEEARGRWLADRKYELEEAAVRAAHATDVDWDGRCTVESKDAVAEKFREMVRLMDLIQKVDPDRRREETLALAMIHGMKEKALDYGIELK